MPLTVQAKQNTRGLRWPSGDLLQARTGRLGRREVLESIWEYGGEKRGQGKAGFSDPIGREPSWMFPVPESNGTRGPMPLVQIRTYHLNLTHISPPFPSLGRQWLWGEAENCTGFNYQVRGGVFWAFLSFQANTRGQWDGTSHHPSVCARADCGPNGSSSSWRCWRGREGSWTEPHWTQAVRHCHPQAVHPYPGDRCPSSGMWACPRKHLQYLNGPGGLVPYGESRTWQFRGDSDNLWGYCFYSANQTPDKCSYEGQWDSFIIEIGMV